MSWSRGPQEAGALPGPLAGWWYRAGATIIDSLIVGVPARLVTYAAPARVVLLVVVLAQLAYATTLLHRRGQTVGMRAVGTRVVVQGGLPTLQQALVRSVVAAVSNILAVVLPVLGLVAGLFTLIDVLWPLWDANNQTIHDKAIGSLVVRVVPASAWGGAPPGTGQAPYGQAPYGQAPFGAAPYGQPAAPGPGVAAEPAAPAAWYPDPAGSGRERWWDGRSWSEHLRDPA